MIFGSVFNYPYKRGYPHGYPITDILARTFRNRYPETINIHKWISVFNGCKSSIIHASMDIHLDIHGFLWISMHRLAMDSRSRVVASEFRTLFHSVCLEKEKRNMPVVREPLYNI